MAVIERTGLRGKYYGTDYNNSEPLTKAQMEINAQYIYNFFTLQGWTVNAIAGILGNMTVESSLNPGRWQSDLVGNLLGGYGLVQWTPATNYTNWVTNMISGGDPSEMDNNLGRIMYELQNGLQYIPTTDYPETFAEFTLSTKSPSYLATAFLKNYERAGVEALTTRIEYANTWYSFLTGELPPTPPQPGTTSKKKKFNFVLFNSRRRKLYG